MNDNNYATQWKQATPRPSGVAGRSRALLRDVALSLSSVSNRPSGETFLRCLFCHYVFDDQKEKFDSTIAELKTIGEFVDTDTCIDMLQGGGIDGRYFHLSFDDGFRNNYTNALPILKKHKIPAIFFVPSSLIDASWTDTQHYCLNTGDYRSVIEMLRWSDLRDMISQGYEIGSHTKTHARFSDISNNRLLMEDEILGSKKELEKKCGYECKYISWPFGTLNDADDISLKMVEEAGYKACFGAYRGTVRPETTNIFSIPRHHFEVQWPNSHIMYFAKGNRELGA